jgi:hypothetical protein
MTDATAVAATSFLLQNLLSSWSSFFNIGVIPKNPQVQAATSGHYGSGLESYWRRMMSIPSVLTCFPKSCRYIPSIQRAHSTLHDVFQDLNKRKSSGLLRNHQNLSGGNHNAAVSATNEASRAERVTLVVRIFTSHFGFAGFAFSPCCSSARSNRQLEPSSI